MKLLSLLFLLFIGAVASIAQTENRPDVAAVVSKADAESILGESVKDAQSPNGGGGDGYYSRCNYYSQLVLRVRRDVGKIDAKKEFELLGADSGQLRPVSGFGDRVSIAPSAVGFRGIDDEKVATEKAKVLAKKFVFRL